MALVRADDSLENAYSAARLRQRLIHRSSIIALYGTRGVERSEESLSRARCLPGYENFSPLAKAKVEALFATERAGAFRILSEGLALRNFAADIQGQALHDISSSGLEAGGDP